MESPSRELPIEDQAKIDSVADEFEKACQSDQAPCIEDYLERLPELRQSLLRELLLIEVDLRRKSGELPKLDDYIRRFPNDRDIVEGVLYPATELKSTLDELVQTGDSGDTELEAEDHSDLPASIGRFQVQRILGMGGFGVVYLAHDPQLDRSVALKVPRRERFKTAEQVANFIQEARTAAKLKHNLLVTVHDVQEIEGLPFIVQEYIAGENLDSWAATQPSIAEIVHVLAQIADALGYLHKQDLTHCDLKLANVLMDEDGQPHVADFGLAVHESVRSRHRGQRFGSPPMMAPEQVRGEGHRLDGRTDIWALGVIMYELLAGRRPFGATTADELFEEILQREPRPIRQIAPGVPKELERICLKCLEKRASDRYMTVYDLREELDAWSSGAAPEDVAVASSNESKVEFPSRSDDSLNEPLQVIPKGLRSFDADDAGFFLQLLPGPRDRNGLPESIAFWKKRIEETDADATFAVGLIYGPSGCGKSSLVKAGLLPRLAESVLPIYIEATAADTEVRILKQFGKLFPKWDTGLSLPDAFRELRERGAGRNFKLLIVIDQFE